MPGKILANVESEKQDEEPRAPAAVDNEDDNGSEHFEGDGWIERPVETLWPGDNGWPSNWEDCDKHPDHGIDFLISMASIAEMYNIYHLKSLVIAQIEKSIACDMPAKIGTIIDKVYAAETAPQEMRDAVVKAVAARIGRLHTSDPVELLERHPEFALEVFKLVVKRDHQRIMREEAEAAEEERRRNR